MTEKKITWKKKMSNADYLKMLAHAQNKKEPNLDDVDEDWLSVIENRTFRTTKQEKDIMLEYFDNNIGGISLEAALMLVPRKRG